MKKNHLIWAALFVATAIIFSSCTAEATFDETLLYGKWQSGTVFEKYLKNGDGFTWDTSDDVTEEEAQPFTWTLVKDRLTQKHIISMGGITPYDYTVKILTSTTLVYEDDYGKSHSFKKVN